MDEKNRGPGNGQVRLARRERERQRHREEILSAAADVFAKHGYDKASMQMIAEEAELSVGKLYMHFRGKEAIYKEIIRNYLEDILMTCDAAVKPGMTPLENVRTRITAAMDHFQEHFEFIRFYFDLNPGGRDEDGKCADDHFIGIISELLVKAVEAGELRNDVDPHFLAMMMEGAAHRLVEWHAERNLRNMGIVTKLLDDVFLKPLETGSKAGSKAEEDK